MKRPWVYMSSPSRRWTGSLYYWGTMHIAYWKQCSSLFWGSFLWLTSLGYGRKCSLRLLLISIFLRDLSGVYLEITIYCLGYVPVRYFEMLHCSLCLNKVLSLEEANTEITKIEIFSYSQGNACNNASNYCQEIKSFSVMNLPCISCVGWPAIKKCCSNWFHLAQKATAARISMRQGRNKVGQSLLWRPVQFCSMPNHVSHRCLQLCRQKSPAGT